MDQLIPFVVVCLLELPLTFSFDTYIYSYDIQTPIFTKISGYGINWFGEKYVKCKFVKNDWKQVRETLTKNSIPC